jgi:ABC-2 type transport system permease protein
VLWYKAWLETRVRFLAALCGVTFILGFFVQHYESAMDPPVLYNNYAISNVDHYLMGLWLLSTILFAMGGLMREKAVGASSFTLALPVSRARFMAVRIMVGIGEAILVAAIPWAAIVIISDAAGKRFPISQACLYALLLVSGGMVYFALAILVSTLIEGEYTAPAVAYGVTVFSAVLFGASDWADPYLNIGKFMSGGFLFDKHTYLLRPEIPWPGLLACWAAAATMICASLVVTERSEF